MSELAPQPGLSNFTEEKLYATKAATSPWSAAFQSRCSFPCSEQYLGPRPVPCVSGQLFPSCMDAPVSVTEQSCQQADVVTVAKR